MMLYQLRMAWRSLLRNPLLSLLLVSGIALGIGVSNTFVAAYYLFSADPLPGASDELYFVRIDNWDADSTWDDDQPDLPPTHLTYRDAVGILGSGIPSAETAAFKAALTVYPESQEARPFRELVRMTHRDFFRMFEVPFQFGGAWDAAAETAAEPVVVLGAEINRRLFGGRDSVGERVRIEDRSFVVTGVLADWRPTVKFYDVSNGPFDPPEQLFMPLALTGPLEAQSAGNTWGWTFEDEFETFADFLASSEQLWLQSWVRFADDEQKAAYRDYLDAYVAEQKRLGRHPRAVNNLLQPMKEWLAEEEVVPEQSLSMMLIGLLFLVVCAVNLIGILLAKFLGRTSEVGVRRALGANRWQIFAQYLFECELIGLLGGVVGLGLSFFGLALIERLFGNDLSLPVHPAMVVAAVALSLAAGLIAGLYPAWRVCRVPPANYLKG